MTDPLSTRRGGGFGPGGSSRRVVRLLLVFVVACGLVGCGSTAPGTDRGNRPANTVSAASGSPSPSVITASSTATPSRTSTPPNPKPAPRTVGILLSAIVGAVNSGERTAFRALVSGQDPGFSSTAEMIFDNLRAIRPAGFELRATGNQRRLSTARASVLGSTSYAVEVRVRWSVAGDRSASDQRVWLTVVKSGGGFRWGGIVDGPSTPRPTPLWWLEPVHYAHRAAATIVSGAQIDTASWSDAANTAITKDAPHLRGAGWNQKLVIIVPSNEQLMEESLGVAAGTNSALAAITWADGTKTVSAPVRIMINPTADQNDLATAIVLAHEAVHVATRSPTSPSPSWLVEGFADYVAYLSYPQAAGSAAADLLAEVKRHGPPGTLPGERDFAVGKDNLNRSYAEAWLACRYLAGRFGSQKLWRFYEAVDTSPDGSIAGPSRSVFGISDHELVSGWQQYLRSAAERGRI